MSIEAENRDNQNSIIENQEEIIKLLKAIVAGVEIITDQENLIDNVED
jgi:hypothetical protein